jgi:glycosyltransferase involved in cell wall biosynthesis
VTTQEILYISYDGMTDPLGQSQVLPYIIGLSKEGYKFTLLSVEKPERFEQNSVLIAKICADNNIDWQPIPYTKKPPVLSTLWDMRCMYKQAYQLHKEKNFTLVHCRSYLPAMIGLSMKQKFGTKFLFDMRGFWADERVDGGLWNLKNPLFARIYAFFKQKETQFLENADGIISLTQAGKTEMETWKNVKRNPLPITLIPCCVDLEHFDGNKVDSSEQENTRKTLGILPSDFVLTYLGSIGTWYLLDEMLQFFKQLQSQTENAKFFFITGDDATHILNRCAFYQIPAKNIIIKQANRKEVPLFLSLSTYSIFFIKPSYSKKSSSPTKQGEIMAMGIPLICNRGVGDTDMIVEKYNAGFIVDEFTTTNYEKVINQVLLNTKSLDTSHLRAGAEDFFSLKKGIAQYLKVYHNCLKN